jgi:hypothetical protein
MKTNTGTADGAVQRMLAKTVKLTCRRRANDNLIEVMFIFAVGFR